MNDWIVATAIIINLAFLAMMMLHFSLSLLLVLKALSEAALVDHHPDRVSSLPGYNAPLPSAWYSGYLDYELQGHKIHTHYILVEAEDVGSRKTPTPLIYWSNGGPGASSLFGLMTELGPLIFSDQSLQTNDYRDTGLPTPIYNTHSWTRLGHVLVFDAPAPVGFSYCDDDKQSTQCLSWTDELASQNTYMALQTFFTTKFPQLQRVPLYLTGESYAGIYIPTLARRIVEGDFETNLKGFAVGDGCLGTHTDICGILGNGARLDYWLVLFLAGHGQIPLSTFQEVMRDCEANVDIGFADTLNDACQEALHKLEKQVGGYYEYALYDECTYRNGILQGGVNDYPCGGGPVLDDYVTLDAVKDAFHVPNATFFAVDNAEGFDYTPTEPDISGFYKSQAGKLKMLVYNGDTDPAITSFAAQNWTGHLGLPVEEEWRPWTTDGCKGIGGYVTRYKGGLDFLTIRGAGHLVPAYKPVASFVFLKSWIEDEAYPVFDKDCKSPKKLEHETVLSILEG
jgi:carboxypeptidase C (cathepsin A)